MQPPSNIANMPEYYVSEFESPEPNKGRARRRSSSRGEQPIAIDGTLSNEQDNPNRQDPSLFKNIGSSMQADLAKMAWEAGSNQMKKAFFLYTNIDLFRPYFDVEPKQVRNRLFQSVIPRLPSSMQAMGADLYGPLVLIFTLVAVLLYTMKTSDYQVKDGTLIGTAIFVCFGYWFFASMGVYVLGYVFVARVAMLQTFSIMGYGLFSHCLVLGISAVAHHFADSHATFYVVFLIFGGLSSLRMAIFFASKTPDKGHKAIMAAVVVALQLGSLLYLHFGYHKMVEEINEILGESPMPYESHHFKSDAVGVPGIPERLPTPLIAIADAKPTLLRDGSPPGAPGSI